MAKESAAARHHRETMEAIAAARADNEALHEAQRSTLSAINTKLTSIGLAFETRPAQPPATVPTPPADGSLPATKPEVPPLIPPVVPPATSPVAIIIDGVRYAEWSDAGMSRSVMRAGDFTLWHDQFGAIVEYPAVGLNVPPLLGPTRIEIERDGQIVHTHVPRYIEPGTRWRWRWKFPIEGLLHDAVAISLHSRRLIPRVYRALMGTDRLPDPAAIPVTGGDTGQQNQMGIVQPEAYAWLAAGRTVDYDAMMADGEAAGAVPYHLRAPDGIGACDPDDPYITLYGAGQDPWRLKLLPGPVSKLDPDIAHQQSVSFLPWLITGDPWHLENLQAQARFNIIYKPPAAPQPWAKRHVHIDQVREAAWGLRTLIHCVLATPDDVPSWLLPKAYWKARLAEYLETMARSWLDVDPEAFLIYGQGKRGDALDWTRAVVQKFPVCLLNGALPHWADQTWSVETAGLMASFWQQDDVVQILGYGVWAGIDDPNLKRLWAAFAAFCVARHLDPWFRISPSPYHAGVIAWNGHVAADVAEAGRMTVERMRQDRAADIAAGKDPKDVRWLGWNLDEPGKFGGFDQFYLPASQAALAMACLNGVPRARDAWTWVNGEMRRFAQPMIAAAIHPGSRDHRRRVM